MRRDRMLGLADWVHLSLRPDTPLLRDKLARGYPHALLEFARDPVMALPEVALLPYNTKAWRTRAAFQPILDPAEKQNLFQRHLETGQFPSLEVLVHYGLDLTNLVQVAFVAEEERLWVCDLLAILELVPLAPLQTVPELFPLATNYRPATGISLLAYFSECRTAGQLLPPPAIPFD